MMRGRKVIKGISRMIVLAGLITSFQSCATLTGGKVQYCQKHKPEIDRREIRPWAFAADMLLFPVALPIDFYTGAIYKPCSRYQTMVVNKKEVRQFYNR